MKVMHEAHMRLQTIVSLTSYETQTYGFDEAHMKLIDIALSLTKRAPNPALRRFGPGYLFRRFSLFLFLARPRGWGRGGG